MDGDESGRAAGTDFRSLPDGMDPALADLDTELLAAFASLDAGFAALDEIGRRGALQTLGPDRLIRVAQWTEAHRSRLAAIDSWVVEAASTADLAAHVAARSLAAAMAQILRISPAAASARVRIAEQLLPKHGFSTGPGAPDLPVLASAVRTGEVTSDQLALISRTMRRLATNPSVSQADSAQAEEALVRHAAAFGPTDLRLIADRIDAALLPDGTEPPEAMSAARRGVTIGKLRPDGTHALTGNLTRALAARLHAVLDPLAAPRPADETGGDPRSAAQRTHDALDDAMSRLLDGPGLPRAGGTPATVHLLVNAEALLEEIDKHTGNGNEFGARRSYPHPAGAAESSAEVGPGGDGASDAARSHTGLAALREWDWLAACRTRGATTAQRVIGRTSSGIPVTLHDLVALASDALLIPVWMSATNGVLAYGRTRRICPESLTHALIARDRGCSFPGCDAPPEWCERHHVVEWLYGGRTDLDELTLVCRYHHDMFSTLGWRVTVYQGLPAWIPPSWVDRARRPVINLRVTNGLPRELDRDGVHRKAAHDEERRHSWRARSSTPGARQILPAR